MKKILLAAFVSLSFLIGMPTFAATTQEEYATTEVATLDGGTAVEEPTEIRTTADTGEAEAETAKKLTPEERNKKIKEADSNGFGITIMSMGIVVIALIILSILFLAFGKISQKLHTQKKMKITGISQDEATTEATSGEAIAAIAAALHEHFNARHDIEDTVLTIRKLKRAYSPWSSKIYGLRQVPGRDVWHR